MKHFLFSLLILFATSAPVLTYAADPVCTPACTGGKICAGEGKQTGCIDPASISGSQTVTTGTAAGQGTVITAHTSGQAGTANTNSDTGFVSLTSIPGLTYAGNSIDLSQFFNNIYRLCIGVAAAIAVLQIMRAGLMYMSQSFTEKKAGKELIGLAIGGLVLVLTPTIVFGIINPDILKLKIGNLDKLKVADVAYTPGTDVLASNLDAICKPYTQKAWVTLPSGKTCADVQGKGFAHVDCCTDSGTSGQVCCAYAPTNVLSPDPAPIPNTATGNYTFILYYKWTDNQGTCLNKDISEVYTSLGECNGDYDHWKQQSVAKFGPVDSYVWTKTCSSSNIAGTPSPGGTWAKLKTLRTCYK